VPFIIPFIPLIAAGIGAATTVAGIESQPSAPTFTGPGAPTASVVAQQPVPPANAGLTAAQKALAQQGGANLQANTGGSFTPDYLNSILQTAFGPSAQNGTGSGATGDIQNVVNQAFGLGAPGQTGYSGGSGGGAGGASAGGLSPSLLASLTTPQSPTVPPTSVGPTSGQPSNIVGSLLEQNFSGFSG
jgi:hypothetical protein